MLSLLFALVQLAVAHEFPLAEQLKAQQQRILQQQDLVSQLARARLSLLQSSEPLSEPEALISVVDETLIDPLFARLIPKAEITVQLTQTGRNLTAIDTVTLKPIGSLKDGEP